MAKKRKHRGIPGNYKLNQHADVFHDRRTRRNRDRASRTRKAIEEQQQQEE